MKKVLLTTVFGALFMTSSLSAKPKAGGFSYDIDLTAGVIFLSNVKTDGYTVVGGVTINDAVAKDSHHADENAYTVFSQLATIAPSSTPTTTFTKKPGICGELTGGISYWCTNSIGVGFDLGYSVISARVKDKATSDTSRISHSLSIMPNVSFYMTDKLVLNVGAGVAWTKVRDLDYINDNTYGSADNAIDVTDNDVNVAAATDFFANNDYKGKIILSKLKNNSGRKMTKAVANNLVDALNAHNHSVNKSFKSKPGFVTKIALSYVYDANTKLSLGYKYTNVKMKTSYNGTHRFKCAMHTINATYTYNF